MIRELKDEKRHCQDSLWPVEVLSLRVSRIGGFVRAKVKEYALNGMLRRIADEHYAINKGGR